MSSSDSPDDLHRSFIRWAQEVRGVQLNGIDGARFPHRGYGIKATRDICKGERIIFVPVKALITIQSPSVKALKLPQSCTVHGRLAAALLQISKRNEQDFQIWERTWPSEGDIHTLPLLWTDPRAELLPPPAKDMLSKQRAKIQIDRKALRGYLDDDTLKSDLYTYYWLVVNSRCFYWDYPTASKGRKPAKRRRKLPPDECMALCPVADYFNHADEGCDFDSDATGCWITADKDYQAGEELYISYGRHSNDFLLVEYGFTLSENKWDVVKLDEFILSTLNASQKQLLEEFGLLGNYSLDKDGICFRTECALRGLILGKQKWRNFMSGDYDGEAERNAAQRRLGEVVQAFNAEVKRALKAINILVASPSKAALLRRWIQMEELVQISSSNIAVDS